jgi:hypothetical protein
LGGLKRGITGIQAAQDEKNNGKDAEDQPGRKGQQRHTTTTASGAARAQSTTTTRAEDVAGINQWRHSTHGDESISGVGGSRLNLEYCFKFKVQSFTT